MLYDDDDERWTSEHQFSTWCHQWRLTVVRGRAVVRRSPSPDVRYPDVTTGSAESTSDSMDWRTWHRDLTGTTGQTYTISTHLHEHELISTCIWWPFSSPHQISWVILVAQDVYGPYRTTNAKTTRHIATWGSCTLTAVPATRATHAVSVRHLRARVHQILAESRGPFTVVKTFCVIYSVFQPDDICI